MSGVADGGAEMRAGAEPGATGVPRPPAPAPRLIVITGERGAGKSVVCARLAALLREGGADVGGVLTERPPAGEGREAVDVATAERRPFGRQQHGGGGALGASGASGAAPSAVGEGEPPGAGRPATGIADPLTPSWRYDDDVFRWGNGVFERARGCEVLIVDELGPVEILGGRGWTRPLEQLVAGDFKTAIVVCRPGLLDRFLVLVGREADAVFEVTIDHRDGLPGTIADVVIG
jgi:nucleoside-triphosphatase THEP1